LVKKLPNISTGRVWGHVYNVVGMLLQFFTAECEGESISGQVK